MEREIDWEKMKKQLPEGTLKPHYSILQPVSFLFKKTKEYVSNLYDFLQWWRWAIGVIWKHPSGPDTNLEGKENHPVVCPTGWMKENTTQGAVHIKLS